MNHAAGAARGDELRAAEVDQLFRIIGLRRGLLDRGEIEFA
jgi:hypothetical protein